MCQRSDTQARAIVVRQIRPHADGTLCHPVPRLHRLSQGRVDTGRQQVLGTTVVPDTSAGRRLRAHAAVSEGTEDVPRDQLHVCQR